MGKKRKNQAKSTPAKPADITIRGGHAYGLKPVYDPELERKIEKEVELEFFQITHEVTRRGLYGAFKEIRQAIRYRIGDMSVNIVERNPTSGNETSQEYSEEMQKNYLNWRNNMREERMSTAPVIDILIFSQTLKQIENKYFKNIEGAAVKHLIRSLRLWNENS